MNNVKKNFIYNIIYQLLIMIIPLITVPYVSRTIGASGLGQYSYTYSIVYYFMIFAMLGLNNYGNRTIAKVRDNKNELSKKFKEIYLMQLLLSLFMCILYLLYIFIFDVEYKLISLIQIFYIFSCIFDINWLYFGLEKFKVTITRNIFVKILSLILIFIFVKDSKDVWIYTLILSFSTFVSQLFLWSFIKKSIINIKIKVKDVLSHFIPNLRLFLPVIAVAIYRVMDKTMLGYFSGVTEVGFYENAEKIIGVPNTIIIALGTVMLPRMSNLYSKGNEDSCKKIIEKSIKFIMFLSFPMCFGTMVISKHFSEIFFGIEFLKSGILMKYLAVTIIFFSWGNVLRTQFLIPKERDKEYIVSAFIGAIVNFILNLILIPKYNSIGACIGTITAEFGVVIYQTISIRKDLPIYKFIKIIIPFLLSSIIMFLIINTFSLINTRKELIIILQIIFGVIIYLLINFKYVKSLVYNNIILIKNRR